MAGSKAPSKTPSKAPPKAHSKAPPKMPSKAPALPPRPGAKPAPPKRRETMEVDLAWIEEEARKLEGKPEPPADAPRKRPPRLPGAARTIPPMPHVPSIAPPHAGAPPKRMTIEVELDWIEAAKASERPRAPAPNAERPRVKPIPREEPE